MDQLGPKALGEILEPGRIADCYLGLLLPPGPAGEPEAGTILIVAPAALLHPRVPQPDGSLVYELLTGHPEREAGQLVFGADLTGELRAWPHDTWAKLGVDPDQVAKAVVGCWQAGEVTGFQVDDLGFGEARSLTRPAMTYVRGQLRGRLTARLGRVHWRWLHPTSGRRPGNRFSPSHRTRRADTGPGKASQVSRTRTAWRTPTATSPVRMSAWLTVLARRTARVRWRGPADLTGPASQRGRTGRRAGSL